MKNEKKMLLTLKAKLRICELKGWPTLEIKKQIEKLEREIR